jgi:lysophospholipase L1-like esterase
MTELSLENIEFIKILAISDATILQAGMNDATRHRLDDEIGTILREYYRENTMNTKTEWTQKLIDVGIDEDAGKAAIACARRLGIDIS